MFDVIRMWFLSGPSIPTMLCLRAFWHLQKANQFPLNLPV